MICRCDIATGSTFLGAYSGIEDIDALYSADGKEKDDRPQKINEPFLGDMISRNRNLYDESNLYDDMISRNRNLYDDPRIRSDHCFKNTTKLGEISNFFKGNTNFCVCRSNCLPETPTARLNFSEAYRNRPRNCPLRICTTTGEQ